MPRRRADVHIRLSIVLLAAIVEFVSAVHTLAQTTVYTVSEVSAVSGQVACRLNNLGDVVGRAGDFGVGTGAATWSHGTMKPKHLGILAGGDYSSGFAINDAGEVAGASNTGSAIVPFFWKVMGVLATHSVTARR
jgi:uncharacterized membrane protein